MQDIVTTLAFFLHTEGSGTICQSMAQETCPPMQESCSTLGTPHLGSQLKRAFGALRNRFKILDNKTCHTYKTQVKLVLACCILHNWILGYGVDEVFTDEDWVPPLDHDSLPVEDLLSQDSQAMSARRDAICNAMWEGRGTHRT
jgi:hypothetical protein